MGMERAMTSAERVAKRRAALRAQGLRPKTFWLPDTSTPEYKARIALSCAAINAQWEADPDLDAWIEVVTDDMLSDLPPPEGLV